MRILAYLSIIVLICSCSNDTSESATIEKSDANSEGLFHLMSSSETGLTFDNHITENIELNTINNDALIQGGGVAVLDVNNDGLQDLFFSGNMVTDQLYLNEGDLRFTNITASSGVGSDKNWSTGAAVVDINNDGYQDIYVCKFLHQDPSRRHNVLYINNQDNTFSEQAEAYGLDDNGYSVMANFFDYDQDGDLDVYVCNQPPSNKELKKNFKPTDYQYTDRLYQNTGGGKFIDVTKSAGVKNACFSLSATVTDFDNDGLPDIYVAVDYDEPDLYYHNQGNGKFINIADKAMKHMSNFSMGADFADINNDGYMDLFTADMVAEDNFRNKTNMSSMAVERFWQLVGAGYHYQFMFNSLQINNGNGTFSEIAQMAGVSKTDWSWSPLFLDADQDGNKDLFVSNGILMEIRNKDYNKNREKYIQKKQKEQGRNYKFDPLELTALAPSVKVKNRSFRGTDDLVFEDMQDIWGFDKPSWSQGMAYADLDNDGDLDLVLNNMNEVADIYRNDVNSTRNHYITIDAKGTKINPAGINTRVIIEYGDGKTQTADITPYRGYMSSCEPVAHFGLGKHDKVSRIKAIFPNGKTWEQSNVPANQKITAIYDASLPTHTYDNKNKTIFAPLANMPSITYEENIFDDYEREVLIPYKMSNLGPALATADVDTDGREDFYIGGAVGQSGRIYWQAADGSFATSEIPALVASKGYEDAGAVFFDVDMDGDLDLYVTSGGNEYAPGTDGYQDRLYLNDGNRQFTQTIALPIINISTSIVKTIDYDHDGDLDLFVGGRQIPGGYGRKVSSLILENTREKLVDVTATVAPDLQDIGMVTDAEWTDIDGDGSEELVIVGEWMAVTILKVKEGKLEKQANNSLEKSKGLWNSLLADDIDGDGDIDLIAGNYGTNYKYKASEEAPFELYVDDFDDNGSNDVYLGYVDESDGKLYPVRGRQCSSQQMPFVEDKYADYDQFGKATVIDVLDGKLDGTNIEKVYTLAHQVLINDGKGNFTMTPLPNRAQASPIYDMVVMDVNNDGKKDVIAVGNFYMREVETTRSDAGVGSILVGDGLGGFVMMSPALSGISADRDVRAVALIDRAGGKPMLAIANNGSEMQFYEQ